MKNNLKAIVSGLAVGTLVVVPIKLPYDHGQSFVIVQGYDSLPTHVKKDRYALDLSQNGCDAYGKAALAAMSGTVMLAQESGYNGGYGTQVLIDGGGDLVSRYAHLIPGSVTVSNGDIVVQGETIGRVGNTGLVAGRACAAHPGTHIHFAVYHEDPDGSYAPDLPEPISGYSSLEEGNWYLSDNGLALDDMPASGVVLGAATQTLLTATSVGEQVLSPPTIPPGAVSESPPVSSPALEVASTSSGVESEPAARASFNSSTLSVDLSWRAAQNASGTASDTIYEIFKDADQVVETTDTLFSYPLADADYGLDNIFDIRTASGTFAIASTAIPSWFTTAQPSDEVFSGGSWYSDTWYDLGTGFSGTIRSLTLEGMINDVRYFNTHLSIAECVDSDCAQIKRWLGISDSAPFTNELKKVTFGDLNLFLRPNKYYRLYATQDYQNRSLILAGTSATGTAMRDEFVYGTGRVEHHYPFYPYLSMVMIPNYPPLAPPNAVATMTIAFDAAASNVILSFRPDPSDPDTPPDSITYQINVATSSVLPADGWQSIAGFSPSIPVATGSVYTLGVRLIDDDGNTSTPLIGSWSYAPP